MTTHKSRRPICPDCNGTGEIVNYRMSTIRPCECPLGQALNYDAAADIAALHAAFTDQPAETQGDHDDEADEHTPADAAPYVTFPADDPKYTRGTHVQWHATAQAMRDYANAGTLTGRDYRVCLYRADTYERTSEQHLSADAIRQETGDEERQMIAAAIAHTNTRA